MSAADKITERLVAGGMTIGEAALLVGQFAVELQPAKSKGALRQERYRERHKASQSDGAGASQSVTKRHKVTNGDVSEASRVTLEPPPSSFSPTPPHITPSPFSSLRSESESSIPRAHEAAPELFGGEVALSADDWPKDGFERFWRDAPRKVGRKAALRAFQAVRRKRETTWAKLSAAWKQHGAQALASDPRFVPHPSTWLNEGRWDDEPSRAEQRSTGPPNSGNGFAAVLEQLGGQNGGNEFSDSDNGR